MAIVDDHMRAYERELVLDEDMMFAMFKAAPRVITPDMLAAGVAAFGEFACEGFARGDASPSEVVMAVFAAMLAKMPA